MFKKVHHIHCIGIGGSGLSALASFLLAQGKTMTGSDVAESVFTQRLKDEGATVFIGHRDENLAETVELVIYSEAIDKAANPEYQLAKSRGLKIMSYFEALGELSGTKKTIVVTGTHGKTTTTAMLGCALIKAGLDPTVIVGSRVPEFSDRNLYIGRNVTAYTPMSFPRKRESVLGTDPPVKPEDDKKRKQLRKSDWLVVEGCEYRRSFLHLQPYGMIVLNCEPDHLDYYKDEADYVSAFEQLADKLPADGFLVANAADSNVQKIAARFSGKKKMVDEALVHQLDFHLKLWGDYNRWNAAHAYQAAEIMGAESDEMRRALETFGGAGRRSEIKGEVNGAMIIDDYGHHPTEVKMTLRAIREQFPAKRIICVFQPHQYSRTRAFLEDFTHAFKDADLVIIPGIYEARDTAQDKKQMSAQTFVDHIAQVHPQAIWGENFEKTEVLIRREAKPGTVVVIMGAGDIGNLAQKLLAKK